MPELRLREVRLPELHLPEMSRDDITRAIGDATRDVELPSVDLSKIDVPKAVASASQAVGLSRSTRVPRLPFIIGGLVTLGLIGFALLNSPAVKPRLQELARKAKEQIEERRAGRMAVDASTDEASTTVDPSGFDAPIAPGAWVQPKFDEPKCGDDDSGDDEDDKAGPPSKPGDGPFPNTGG